MKIVNVKDVKPEPGEEGCEGMTVRWLITAADGAKNCLMRVFEIEPGGASPYHSHVWEQVFYVLGGSGRLTTEGKAFDLEPGVAAYLPPRRLHRVESIGNKPLVVLECAPPLAEATYHFTPPGQGFRAT